jgi:hypothetical protein
MPEALPLPSSINRKRINKRPCEEKSEYWLSYFHCLKQAPLCVLTVDIQNFMEHEVRSCHIRNGEGLQQAYHRRVRKLKAMLFALEALGGCKLAPLLNGILQQLAYYNE